MILLSFDTEEFDVPLENGVDYDPIAQGMDVSRHGTAGRTGSSIVSSWTSSKPLAQ